MAHFERRGGVADGAGQSFEVKVIALLFLRGHNKCKQFRIASNMEHCGAFDDIIFQYKQNDIWHTSFLQLKHKKNLSLPLKSFHMSGNDFDLFKYLQSYHTILKCSSSTSSHPVFDANLDYCSFYLYTNAVFNTKRQLQHGQFLHDDIHNSGGGNGFIFGFSEDNNEDKFIISLFKDLHHCQESVKNICERNRDNEVLDDSMLLEIEELVRSAKRSEVKDLLENVKKQPTRECLENMMSDLDFVSVSGSFLKNVKVLDGQSGVDSLNDLIRKEIYEICGTDQYETNEIFNELIQHVEWWWRHGTEYLTKNTQFWNDMMQSRTDRVCQLSSHKLQQLDSFNICFRDAQQSLLSETPINVVADKSCTMLSCIKIRQALEISRKRKYIFIDFITLQHKEKEILSLWPTCWCDTLVVDCGKYELLGESVLVQKCSARYGLIIVSNNIIPDFGLVHFDVCGFKELDERTQRGILDRNITFQGYEVQLGVLSFKNECILNTITADLVWELSQLKCPKIGLCPRKIDFKYIKRTLCDPNEPVESTSNRAIYTHSLLSINERTILLSADPGMGKSVFLRHMALQTKEANPTLWIIAVNLNEHSADLDKLSDSDCSVEMAMDFLWEVAGKHHGCDFEWTLFWHTVQTSGTSVVLLDAFDEISPTYTKKALHLIKAISNSRVGKLCVAFRPVVREMLESMLHVSSFTLTALSHQDQVELLYSLWIQYADKSFTHSQMQTLTKDEVRDIRTIFGSKFFEGDALKNLDSYSRYVLSPKSKSDKFPDSFWSVPLHVTLLATVYESYVIVSMNDGCMYAPQKFNIIDLYSAFVEKKLGIYCREKKDEAEELSAVLDDNEILREQFMENHAMAAIVALLPPDGVRELHDKEIELKTAKFLKRIEEGKEKRGVVVKVIGGRPHFVHRTFAEYFCAIWFSKNYIENKEVLKKLYFSPMSVVFREMFDRILSDNCELHQHILSYRLEEFLHVVSDYIHEVDAGGRTALHIAAVYQEQFHIVRGAYPLWTFVDSLLHHGSATTTVDKLFHMTPLEYAENVRNLLSLREMFRSPDFEPSNNSLMMLCQHMSCNCNSSIREDLDAGQGLLISVEAGNFDVAFHLLRSGVYSNVKDGCGNTALHIAVCNSMFELVRMLVEEWGADVGARNQNNLTATDVAEKCAVRRSRHSIPPLEKCMFYYSEEDSINLPYRNWNLLKSYYNSERTKLNYKTLCPCHYEFVYWHMVAQNFIRCISRLTLEYMTEIASTNSCSFAENIGDVIATTTTTTTITTTTTTTTTTT